MAGKPFNGLSGLEIRMLVLKELASQIALDDRFGRADRLVKAILIFTLRVEFKTAPANDPEVFTVQITEPLPTAGDARQLPAAIETVITRHLSMDLRFTNNIVYPFISWTHRTQVELTAAEGQPSRPIEVAPIERPQDPTPFGYRPTVETPQIIQPNAPSRTDALQAEIARLQAQLADAGGARVSPLTAAGATPYADRGENTFLPRSTTPPKDADDMQIRGAWGVLADPEAAVRSSGSGAPMAIAVGHTPDGTPVGITPEMMQREDQVIVEVRHPALAHGGLGSPDTVRRDAGLTVPSPQSTTASKGGIVDLPAGSF